MPSRSPLTREEDLPAGINSTKTASFYLVMKLPSRTYDPLLVRLTSNAPSLAKGEVPMKIDMEVPMTVFYQPTLKASIVIDTDQAQEIEAEVIVNALEHAVKGLKVEVCREFNVPDTEEV